MLGQTLTKPACSAGWQASGVSSVCCWCVLGIIIGLANAAFSGSTAKWGRVQKACLPTGRDRIIKWQMLFSQFCCFLLSSSEHSGAAWVLRGTSATEWCFWLKKKTTKNQTNASCPDCRTCFLVMSGWGKTTFHGKGLGLLLGCWVQALCCKYGYLPGLLFKFNPVNSCLVGRWRFRDWKTWGWWPKGIWKCGMVVGGKFSTRGISLNSMAWCSFVIFCS